MGLAEYKRKRDFKKTAEPAGGKPLPEKIKGASRFVIQKHAARRLHYDFRLEMEGVLKSWALPKGLPWKRGEKHLAMQVEDHPIEYADFEGIIPEGEYGGGTVMVWDRGTWTPELPDVDAALRKGELKFSLEGEKLRGSWVLVRTRAGSSGKPSWLLIKHRDTFASADDIATSAPRSVVSNRIMAEIAWQEGGNVDNAASADPPAEIRRLIANPSAAARRKRRKPSVWHSKRALS